MQICKALSTAADKFAEPPPQTSENNGGDYSDWYMKRSVGRGKLHTSLSYDTIHTLIQRVGQLQFFNFDPIASQ
jgi:hypothetical protein